MALLLAGLGSTIATGLAPLLAALASGLALVAPLAPLAPLAGNLRLVARTVITPSAVLALGSLVPAVLALALGSPPAPVVLFVVLSFTCVRTIFRTGIVVWHGTPTESARRENGSNRSEQFSSKMIDVPVGGVEKGAIRTAGRTTKRSHSAPTLGGRVT